MATTTPATPTANGDAPEIGIMGITISEADYQLLLAERRELRDLRAAHEFLREQFAALRESYQHVHHAYYLKVKDELGLDEQEPLPPIDVAGAIPFSQFLAELEREHGGS